MGGVVGVQGRGGWLMEGTRTYSARPSVRPVALQRRRASEHDETLPAVLRGHARQRVAASRPWIVAPLVDVELRAQHRAASHATTTGRLSLATPKSLIYLFFQKKKQQQNAPARDPFRLSGGVGKPLYQSSTSDALRM